MPKQLLPFIALIIISLVSSCADNYPPEGSIWVPSNSRVNSLLCNGCKCISYTGKIIIYDMKEKKIIYSHAYEEPLAIGGLPVGTELEIRYENLHCFGVIHPPTEPIATCVKLITAPKERVVLPQGEGIYAPMRVTCL